MLPNNFISKGFDVVDKKVQNSERWNRFSLYWKRQWRTANISVYGLRHRTNNFLESLNKSTNFLSGRSHQDIWSVIRTIKSMEMDKVDELEQNVDGKMFKTKPNKFTIEMNEKILDATLIFEETEDVDRFLSNVSYRGDIVLTCTDSDSDNSEGEDCKDDDSDDGFFDDFIANDFDESNNFVRNDAQHRNADFFKVRLH